MRIVVALGGNALLRRGQAMTADQQRENIRVASEQLAPVAMDNELVISHGNGPQVGLLALQGSAYKDVETYCVVVCAGGGGIPVMHTDEPVPAGRRLVGVEAVIDKDLASARLAAELRADVPAIVTDVDA